MFCSLRSLTALARARKNHISLHRTLETQMIQAFQLFGRHVLMDISALLS